MGLYLEVVRLTPGSALSDHSWWTQRTIWYAADRTQVNKASILYYFIGSHAVGSLLIITWVGIWFRIQQTPRLTVIGKFSIMNIGKKESSYQRFRIINLKLLALCRDRLMPTPNSISYGRSWITGKKAKGGLSLGEVGGGWASQSQGLN